MTRNTCPTKPSGVQVAQVCCCRRLIPATRLAGYDEAFALLDAVVRALSEDVVPLGPVPEHGLVTDARSA